jgi:hypothetical protein
MRENIPEYPHWDVIPVSGKNDGTRTFFPFGFPLQKQNPFAIDKIMNCPVNMQQRFSRIYFSPVPLERPGQVQGYSRADQP